MKFRQIILWMMKAFVAVVISFAIMCGFSFFYDNVPAHFDNLNNSTDYKYESNKFYSKATEGIAFGHTNNDGFNNELDLGEKDIDILLMGSSQEEAFNVKTSESTAAQLNRLFGNNYYTYSIAHSSQTLPYFVRNLESALKTYKPKSYVLFEVQSILITPEIAQNALNNTLERLSSAKGIAADLQKVPYLKVLYHQFNDYKALKATPTIAGSDNTNTATDEYTQNIDGLMQKIEELCAKYNVTPIIYYQPHLSLNNDKTVNVLNIDTPLNEISGFYNSYVSLCQKHNITFIDMTDDFLKNYNEKQILPHGYCNTKVGVGHLNAEGHRIIAERLYATIEEKAVTR